MSIKNIIIALVAGTITFVLLAANFDGYVEDLERQVVTSRFP